MKSRWRLSKVYFRDPELLLHLLLDSSLKLQKRRAISRFYSLARHPCLDAIPVVFGESFVVYLLLESAWEERSISYTSHLSGSFRPDRGLVRRKTLYKFQQEILRHSDEMEHWNYFGPIIWKSICKLGVDQSEIAKVCAVSLSGWGITCRSSLLL